jgi:hypothetical protein
MPFVRPAPPFVDVLELHPFRTDVRVVRGAAAALLVVATVALTGCGSSDKSESSDASKAAAWADGLCGAVAKWKGSLESVGATVKDVDQLSKAKLEQASTDVSAANTNLADDLKALGEPPETGGSEAKAAVDNLAKELGESADDIRNATQGISSAQDAVAAVNVATGALLTMSSDISATLATLESLDAADAWKNAFADSEACKSLNKS